MIGRAHRWFDRVLPWPGLHGVIAFLVLVTAIQWLFYGGLYLVYGALPDEWDRMLIHRPVIVILLVLWGFWRSGSNNPAFRAGYGGWLMTTPWTPGRPLPLGPVELVWQDAVLLVLASALFWMWPQSLLVPLALLLPYCFTLGVANYRAGQDEAVFVAVLLTVLLPLSLFYVERYPWGPLVLTGLITVATLWGWRKTIRLFPWENLPRLVAAEDRTSSRIKGPRYDGLWPRVHPLDSLDLKPRVSWRRILMIATGVAWVAAVGAYTFKAAIELALTKHGVTIESLSESDLREIRIDEEALAAMWIAAWIVALVRLGVYGAQCAAPISLYGRWVTRRLIIPGYDQILLAPLAVLGIGLVLPSALLFAGLPLPAVVFVSMFLLMMAAFGLGPSLAEWQLTGEHRLRVTRAAGRGARRNSAARVAGRAV